MQHALELALKGVGLASPNPTVGSVIVHDGQIVGEGFHEYDKRDHAEIVALKSAGARARGATVYVTLEPCNHAGRTGPCTAGLQRPGRLDAGAAMEDPNPFLNYFALGLLFFVVIVLIYGIIAIHDIPARIAHARHHPHEDAIHAAGWISLFMLHLLWPFLWIWAMMYQPGRGWGFSEGAGTPVNEGAGTPVDTSEIEDLRRRIAELEKSRTSAGG